MKFCFILAGFLRILLFVSHAFTLKNALRMMLISTCSYHIIPIVYAIIPQSVSRPSDNSVAITPSAKLDATQRLRLVAKPKAKAKT